MTGEIRSRKQSDTTPFPKGCYRGLAAALALKVEPEKETAFRAPVAIAVSEHLVGDVEILPVERPALADMLLVGPGRDRDMLDGQGHLRASDITEAAEGRDEAWVAGNESRPKARQPGALGEGLEDHDIGKAAMGRQCDLERALWRALAIDLRIAFVGEQHEAEAAGKRDRRRKVAAIRDGALRVRRRAEIERNGAFEQLGIDRLEVGEEARRRRAGEKYGLGAGDRRRCRVGRVEGVGDQHRRPGDRALSRDRRKDGGEQPLA